MSRHRPEKVQSWRRTIDAWERSGQSVNAFCRDRRLTRSNFDRWRRIFAAEPGVSAPSSVFVPVRVVAEPIAEVVLRSGVVVRVPLGAAPDAVTRLSTGYQSESGSVEKTGVWVELGPATAE